MAVTIEPDVRFNPVVGDQVYELAPPAVIVVELPEQIVAFEEEVIVGIKFTVTEIVFVVEQLLLVPVTV